MLYVCVSHLYNFPFSTKSRESLKVGLGVLVLGEGEQTGKRESVCVCIYAESQQSF